MGAVEEGARIDRVYDRHDDSVRVTLDALQQRSQPISGRLAVRVQEREHRAAGVARASQSCAS